MCIDKITYSEANAILEKEGIVKDNREMETTNLGWRESGIVVTNKHTYYFNFSRFDIEGYDDDDFYIYK